MNKNTGDLREILNNEFENIAKILHFQSGNELSEFIKQDKENEDATEDVLNITRR